MKIKKLVAATGVKACGEIDQTCSISAQEDYSGAIDCIQNAINFLAHTVQCDKDDIVARESIANLAVVLLDLKSAHSDTKVVESAPVDEIVIDDGLM